MRIECWIDYWEEGVLNFNPEKVRSLFFQYFPEAIFDKTNYSRFYLEKFFHNVKKKNLEPPELIIDGYWDLAFQNGPTFKSEILSGNNKKIIVCINRYRVSFDSDFVLDNEDESKIIEFLRSLRYGRIISNHQTKNFSEPLENRKDYWKLKVISSKG